MSTSCNHVLTGMNELSVVQMNGSVAPTPLFSDSVPFEHRVFSKPQMAAYFAVEIRTIETWMKEGVLPFIKIGRTVRFRGGDIAAALDALRQSPHRQGRIVLSKRERGN